MKKYEITASPAAPVAGKKLGVMKAPDLQTAIHAVLSQLPIDIQHGGYVLAIEMPETTPCSL